MDIEKIEKFIDAGYTKEDIDKMLKSPEPSEPIEQGEEAQIHAGEVKEEQEAPDDAMKALADTVAELSKTVKEIQSANIKAAHTDKPKATDAIKAAMDSFIESI